MATTKRAILRSKRPPNERTPAGTTAEAPRSARILSLSRFQNHSQEIEAPAFVGDPEFDWWSLPWGVSAASPTRNGSDVEPGPSSDLARQEADEANPTGLVDWAPEDAPPDNIADETRRE